VEASKEPPARSSASRPLSIGVGLVAAGIAFGVSWATGAGWLPALGGGLEEFTPRLTDRLALPRRFHSTI
jgi:hypothetical protein